MPERKPLLQEATKEAVKPVKIIWKLFGTPVTSTIKEQYVSTKLSSLFDNLATRFPRSKTLSSASESLKKKP